MWGFLCKETLPKLFCLKIEIEMYIKMKLRSLMKLDILKLPPGHELSGGKSLISELHGRRKAQANQGQPWIAVDAKDFSYEKNLV